jgi:3-dehydroquinate dehydratase/shikimate dehydrogenase
MTEATIVASVVSTHVLDTGELSSLPACVKWLEVRGDLAEDLDGSGLRSRFSGKLIYTLRSSAEFGHFDGTDEARHRRLLRAAKTYDVIDLEGERDLVPELLSAIPANRRMISWSGPAVDCAGLNQRLSALSAVPALFYRLVPHSTQSGDELAGLMMLKRANRSDVIAYTTGNTSFWSRLIAPQFGCPMVFGTTARHPAVVEEPTVSQLIEDYNLPKLAPVREIYGIVGNPIYHSLSPRVHNAAYRALGYPALFVPFHVQSFEEFWNDVVAAEALQSLGISIRGFTVASPHKEAALRVAAACSPMVKRAGSTNIFVRNNGGWKADTTDPEGVVQTIKQRGIDPRRRKVAVIGCGGSGRAIAAALDESGAEVTLVNRGLERGRRAVDLLCLPFVPLSKFSPRGYSMIVNATPVGREGDELPFRLGDLGGNGVIVDLVYGAKTTSLIADAIASGGVAIDGLEVLFVQVRRQFHMMTGREMPLDLVSNILRARTGSRSSRNTAGMASALTTGGIV